MPRCPRAKVDPGAADQSPYVKWTAEIARAENAPFIDLNALVLKRYVDLSPEAIREKYFTVADGTHTSPAGAALNAEAVVEGIRGLGACPLAAALREPSKK